MASVKKRKRMASSKRSTGTVSPSRRSAHAVAADGSIQSIDADFIVVDLGTGAAVVIDLTVAPPALEGRIRIRTQNDGLLVVGPGDAGSICVGVEASSSSWRQRS